MTLRAFVLLATTAVAACGGGYKDTTSTGGGTTTPPPTTTVTPAAISLFAASTQMLATADTQAEGDTLTAVVTDANSNTISGAKVTFSITSGTGAIIVTQGTTDSTGTATAVLTTGGDATFPRTIVVTATAGTVTDNVSVSVVDPAAPPVTPASIAGISMFASDAQLFDDADTAAEGVTLTAVVTNAQGNVVSGVPVSFAVTTGPAALVVSRDTTDSTGTAVAILTTNGVRTARNVTITASVTSGSTTFSSPVTLPVIGHAKKITGTINSLRLNQSGNLIVTARAEDANGNPVGNVPITFVVTAGSVTPATMTTNASGATVNPAGGNSALVTAGASVAPGSIIHITMTAPGATADSADIVVVPDVASVTLRATSTNLKADADTVAEGISVTAVAADANGALLDGERVNFSLKNCAGSAGTAAGGGLTPGFSETDTSGNALSVVTTGGASLTIGSTVNVSARSASNAARCSDLTLTVVDPNTPATPPGNVNRVRVFASAGQLLADADTAAEGVTITGLATDSAGNTLAGVDIGFSVTTSNGALQVIRGTTDATGTATAILTTGGDTTSRNITVQASVPTATTPTATVTLPVIGHATTVIGTLSSPQLPADDSVPVTVHARALDASGNLVANVPVTFFLTSGTISGGSACATPSVRCTVLVTGTSGQTADATISTGGSAAPRTITVSMTAQGATAATADISVSVAQAMTLSTSPASIPADNSSTATLTATLTDTNGQPMIGQTVTFSTNGAGSIANASAVTDRDGNAIARLTAGTVAGRATVTARHAASGLSASAPVIFTAGPAANVALTVAPATVRPGGTATLDVTVIDANGNPVDSELVSLNVSTNTSGGVIASTSLLTDGNGRATTTYSAGVTAGSDTIQARLAATGATSSKVLSVNAAAAQIASVELSAGDTSPVASNTVFTVFRAVVTDTAGNLVNGAVVSFSSTSGAFSSTPGPFTPATTATTDSTGTAQLFLRSPNASGSATVRASTGGFTASQPITFVAGAATNVTIIATPGQMAFGQSSTLRATVTDANLNAVAGEGVTFKVTTNGSGGVLTGAASVITDTGGVATTTYQAGSAAFVSTSDVITASIAAGVSAPATITISASVGTFTITAGNTQIVADGTQTTTITGTVRDRNGTPVSGAAVTCTTSAGTVTPNTSVTSDSNGEAPFTLKSSSIVGNAVVLCGIPGLSATQVVQFVAGAANTVTMTASPSTVAQAGTSTITATVTDAGGNVVPNEPLAFSITTINTGSPSLSAASATTDANGRATVTYTGGTTAAMDTITAKTAGNKSNTVDVTISANTQVVQSLALSIGGVTAFPTSVQVATDVGLRATVVDTNGAPVTGVTVTFTSTDGTFVGAVNTAVSDSNGHADVTLTTPNYATSGVIVTASASGLLAQGQMTIIPGPAVASTSAITANPSTLIADGQSTTTVTVILNDAQGNPVADGRPVTLITSPNGAGTFIPGNSTVTASGRATFTVQSPSTSSTATIKVQDLPTLFTNVTFASPSANTTGDPASIGFVASATTISVAGVGQTEQLSITATVRDSAGNVIAEGDNTTGYQDTTFNNLRVEFVTQPHGGETITGKKADGTITSSTSGSQFVDVRTSNGVAVLTLHAGTIPGIVELKFTVKAFDQVTDATTGSLPQVSIASGPPHTIAFTHPITNSVEDLTGGSYRRRGQAVVTDRYGNHVPDGTVVNLSLIDSVIAQGNGGTIGASSTLTGGGNLLERVCTTPPPPSGGEASTCTARGALTDSNDFSTTLTRNNTSRGIQANDHIYVLNADTFDKSRVTSGTPSTVSTVDVQTPYLYTNSQPTAANAQYWIGGSLSGGFISGCTVADAACTGSTLTTGTGIVFDGIAGFRVTYPANVGSILLGCYGYQPSAGYAPTQYHDKDKRDQIPQSRQVVIAASSGDGATGVNAGEFCFAPIAGSKMTPTIDTVLASPTAAANPASPQVSLSFQLRDGGDTIPLPYVPISCYESERNEDTANGSNWDVTVYSVLDDGAWQTFVDGFGYVKVDIVGTIAKKGDSTTITCSTTGGFEAASTSFLINVQ